MHFRLPRNIEEKDIPYFSWIESHPLSQISFEKLKWALFYKSRRIYITGLKSVSGFDGNLPTWKGIMDCIRRRSVSFFYHTICIVINPWSQNYYHWFTEVIPRIIKLRNSDSVFFFPFFLTESYQVDSLNKLGVRYDSKKTDILLCRSVIFCQNTIFNSGHYYNGQFDELRNFFVEKKDIVSDKLIYIARKTTKRGIVNENEIIALLSAMGFIILSPEEYSLEEQIENFIKAKVVIGLHGAGLTNMLFCPSGTVIVELGKKGEKLDKCYFNLANNLDFDYYHFPCEAIDEDTTYYDAIIKADLESFESLVRSVLNKLEPTI